MIKQSRQAINGLTNIYVYREIHSQVINDEKNMLRGCNDEKDLKEKGSKSYIETTERRNCFQFDCKIDNMPR